MTILTQLRNYLCELLCNCDHTTLEGVNIMYIVKADNPAVGFSIDLSNLQVKDSEGHVIADPNVEVLVESDNPAAVSVEHSEDGLSGTLTFGDPGDAAITATIHDADSDKTLGVFGAQFHVTTGDPASMSGGSIHVEGLTEATS